MNKKNKNMLKNLLLFLVTLTIIFFLCEISLRFFYPQNTCAYYFDESDTYRALPNSECIWLGYSNEFRVPVWFNSKGYKDTEHSYIKPENTTRILVLGDSYVEALQVRMEQQFSKVLESRLNKESKGNRFEVISMGISGFGTGQELVALEKEGLDYSPDIIMLAFTTGNDVGDNILRPVYEYDSGKLIERYAPINKDSALKKTKRFLRQHSQVYALFADTLKKNKAIQGLLVGRGIMEKDPLLANRTNINEDIKNYDMQIFFDDYSQDIIMGWNQTKRLLKEIKEVSDNANLTFILFIIPNGFQVDKTQYKRFIEQNNLDERMMNITKPQEIIVQFGKDNNIITIDLLPVFREKNINNSFYWKYDGHWNAAGHKLAAEIVYKELKSRGFV